MRFVTVMLLAGLACGTATGDDNSGSARETADRWIEERFSPDRPAELPFSFRYAGQSSRDLLGGWTTTTRRDERDANRLETTRTFTDPATGLTVRCVATFYRDFPAVEWVLTFQNGGEADTPLLSEILAIDAPLDMAEGDAPPTLHYGRGSHALITDFEPLSQSLLAGEEFRLGSFGGRSSDGTLPFFNLAATPGRGASVDIGWTGQWQATFVREAAGLIRVRAGMEHVHTTLHPGEQIRSPAILLMFWNGGDWRDGQNLHRRLLRQHATPPVTPPIAASPHAVFGFEKTTEGNLLELIGNVEREQIEFDYWWIDAGWYTCADNWARWVGNPEPDPTRFPRGLRPIRDAARATGMKFLLWFEPERAMPGSWLQTHHPDWLIRPPENLPAELKYQFNDGFHLVDLGNPEARGWIIDWLSRSIDAAGIDAFRNDFNMYPVDYWRSQDAPDRQAMTEIRYVTGLYQVFDTLRERHPELLIDNCASGGRRIDFEMLRRSLVLTRSDYLWDPIGQQCHTYGLAPWIPVTGIGAASVDAYSVRSGLGAHFSLAANYAAKDPETWQAIGKVVREFRVLQPFFAGDFFPLGSYSTQPDVWMAWQFHRPEHGDGMVQAFRRPDASDESATFPLRGLERDAIYEVTSLDAAESERLNGGQLLDRGLTVRLTEKPAAAVLIYRKVAAPQ